MTEETGNGENIYYAVEHGNGDDQLLDMADTGRQGRMDAEFIAHAREDIPRLLAVIEALSDWAGRSKTGFYDEAQDDVVAILSAALKGAGDE